MCLFVNANAVAAGVEPMNLDEVQRGNIFSAVPVRTSAPAWKMDGALAAEDYPLAPSSGPARG